MFIYFIVVENKYYTEKVLKYWTRIFPLRCKHKRCRECLFYRAATLVEHYEKEHGFTEGTFECIYCMKKFITPELRQLHSICHFKDSRQLYYNDALVHMLEGKICEELRCTNEYYNKRRSGYRNRKPYDRKFEQRYCLKGNSKRRFHQKR